MERTLDMLLEEARIASPLWRMELRDPIAAFDGEAIVRIAPWLGDRDLSRFAVRVVGKVGQDPDHKREAVEVLRSALVALSDIDAREDIEDALVLLGERKAPAPRAKPRGGAASGGGSGIGSGLRPARGPFMRSWTFWHQVVGSVGEQPEDLRHMSACHRWNSEWFIQQQGDGLQEAVPADGGFCENCANVEASGNEATGEWVAQHLPIVAGSTRLHLRSNETWHFAVAGDSLLSDELGDVFLTECGWWIERPRVTAMTAPRMGEGGGHVCEPCIANAQAREMGEQRI